VSDRPPNQITSQQASALLDCSVQHIRHLIRQGRISGSRFGRDWAIDEPSVREYQRSAYVRPKQEIARVAEAQVSLAFTTPELEAVTNVASVPQRSPFRYPGGKTWLVPVVRSWLKARSSASSVLVEPFAGGAIVGLTAVMESLVSSVELAELDEDIAAVWSVVLSGQAKALCKLILDFPCNEPNVCDLLQTVPASKLEHAFQTIVRNRVSRGGILAPGAGLVKHGEAGRGMASRWYPETLVKRIQEISRHKGRIHFHHGDGIELLESLSSDPNVLIFADPPYTIAGRRLYRHHHIDHERLFKALGKTKASFLATYDDNTYILGLAQKFGFSAARVPMKSTHHLRKYELLISRELAWHVSGSEAPLIAVET